jgi:predicted outer membrane repeat protein
MKPYLNSRIVFAVLLALALCVSPAGPVLADRNSATIQSLINAAVDGGTVNIPAGTYSETLTVDKNLTLKGVSSGGTILEPGAANQRVISVTTGHNLRLETLRITGATLSGDVGGGVYLAGGNLVLDQVEIDHNQAVYGGGVFQTGTSSSVTVTNSTIDHNTASTTGGGIYADGSASLTNTALFNNNAGNHGGGIHVNSGTATLNGGTVSNNSALNGNGGGVNVNGGLSVSGTIFANNSAGGTSAATGSGGAITQWNTGQSVSINQATFSANHATINGGAVFINESFLILTNSTFSENVADSGASSNDSYGGGVFAGGGLHGSGLAFSGNTVKCTSCSILAGGGLYIKRPSTGPSTITQSVFDRNVAWFGSGISSESSVQLTLTNSSFTNNGTSSLGGYGGGVDAYWMHGDKLFFQNNKVMNFGGALNGTVLELTNSRFIANMAGVSGGAVHSNSSFTGANLVFGENESSNGAALSVEGGIATLYHATIACLNRHTGSALFIKAGANLTVKNSILSAYSRAIRALGTVTEDYNLLYNNQFDYDPTGGGTINYGSNDLALKDPLFVNLSGNDYHLRWPSPAIGEGTDLSVSSDLDEVLRQGRVDIGAYQYIARVFLPLVLK